MNAKSNARPNRPLPNQYNKINDLDISPKREKRRKRINYTKIIALICVILVVIIIIFLYYLLQKHTNCRSNVQICHQKECIISAAKMLRPMQTSFHPCDDFYQYSCGEVLGLEQQNQNNVINQLGYKLNLDLKNAIQSLSDDKQHSYQYLNKVFQYYKSCLNEELIEKHDIKPLSDLIERLGGWPVLKGNQWPIRYKHFHWINTYIMMRKIGLNANSLFSINVEIDVQNKSRYMIVIDRPLFNIAPDVSNDSEMYFNLMVKIAQMMGSNKVDAENDLLNSLILEKQLIQLSQTENHRNNTYMNVRQLQILAPNIDWIQLLTEFTGSPISDGMEVIVLVPNYIRKLNQKVVQIDPKVLVNYMIWKVIYENVDLISKRWRETKDKYLLNTIKNYRNENQWQKCVKQIQYYMPLQLANIYIKRHYIANEVQVFSMINYIKESFVEIVDGIEWMSDDVKNKTKEKILLMALKIGFPKELQDESQMDSWFSDIDIGNDYFNNTLSLNLLRINERMENLFESKKRQKINKQDFVNPTEIILKYSPEGNSLSISMGLINGFYGKDVPKYLNYGSFGILMSYEMINVLMERRYEGVYTHGNWWDKDSNESFQTYKSCYQKQIKESIDVFKQMSNKDRIESIEQLITDNIVFRQTILGYRAHIKQSGPDFALIGVNHSSEQLFWINSVNDFCNINEDNELWNSFEAMKYRVNSIVSNIKEFSQSFNCTTKSSMNNPINC